MLSINTFLTQPPLLICVQVVEKPSDVPVETQDDETEKTLIERIRSIKQEK